MTHGFEELVPLSPATKALRRTRRTTRRYKPEPVPDEAIAKILEAATHAPSASNRQPWHFLVVRDPELRRQLGKLYWAATEYAREHLGLHKENPTYVRSGCDFTQHVGEAPVLILPLVETGNGNGFSHGSNIFMAIQNLLLAARSLGLGSSYTGNIRAREEEVKASGHSVPLDFFDRTGTTACLALSETWVR